MNKILNYLACDIMITSVCSPTYAVAEDKVIIDTVKKTSLRNIRN